MNVDETPRDERVAGGCDVAQTGAESDDEVGIPNGAGQIGSHPQTQMADVGRVPVIEEVLTPEGGCDGQGVGRGEMLQGCRSLGGPAGATDDNDGTLRLCQFGTQRVQIFGTRRRLYGLVRRGIGNCGGFREHVLRERQHNRARAARRGALEGAMHEFGDARGGFDFGHPFGERREHLAEFHFLKGLAAARAALYLADEEDHRGGVLKRGVNADAGMGSAGTAGHHAYAGPAGELAIGFGHVGGGAFMFGDDDLDFGRVVEGVEDVEVAFAGDAEDAVGAVDSQGVGKDAAAAAGLFGHTISKYRGLVGTGLLDAIYGNDFDGSGLGLQPEIGHGGQVEIVFGGQLRPVGHGSIDESVAEQIDQNVDCAVR
jgi:hypothetical protein